MKWLGFTALAFIILALLLAVLMAIKIIAVLGGLVIAVVVIACALKGVYEDRRVRQAKAQASAAGSSKSYS